MTTPPLLLTRDAVHLDEDQRAISILSFGHDYEGYVAKYCGPDRPGRLVTVSESREDWPVWECHPLGDELVVLLSGKAEFIQRIDGQEHRVIVGVHEAIVNPAGVSHTANVIEPFLALYITPGPGTTHEPRAAHGRRS